MAAKKKRSRTSLAQMGAQGDIRITIDISSQQKMLKKLDRLDDRTRMRVLRPAMLKGIQKIKRKLKDTAPQGDPQDDPGKRKRIKRAFAHTIRNQGGTIMTRTGLPEGYSWAHMLHTGAPPHVIKPRRGKILRMIFGGFARTIQHPGFAPNPFVVNAIKTTGRAVRAAVTKKTWQGIVKEARRR